MIFHEFDKYILQLLHSLLRCTGAFKQAMKSCTKLCQIVRISSMKSITFPKQSFVTFHSLTRLDNPRSFHLSSSLFKIYTIAIFRLIAVYDLRYVLLFQPTFDLPLTHSSLVELAPFGLSQSSLISLVATSRWFWLYDHLFHEEAHIARG